MPRPPRVALVVGAQLAAHLAAAHLACAQPLDTAGALGGLRDFRTACTADAGRLWGRSLCGPVALTEPTTRLAVLTDTVPGRPYVRLGDAYLTVLPGGLALANTSMTWAGRTWATARLPLDTSRFARTALLAHEAFHRAQDSLGLSGADPANAHLDTREGRRWLRLELRALAAALDALPNGVRPNGVRPNGVRPNGVRPNDAPPDAPPGAQADAALPDGARAAARDALLFRARRRALFPAADSLEPALEMQEGLAEYTGARLALALTGGGPARVARAVRGYEGGAAATPTYVRSFAYATGPALGLLLDAAAPAWRADVRRVRDPARLLGAALGWRPPATAALAREAERRAARYGGEAVAREEAARDAAQQARLTAYRRRLLDGPTVAFRQQALTRTFDPQALVTFDDSMTVYPTGTFGAAWGTLEVTRGGALVANDFTWLRVAAPTDVAPSARAVAGDGWTLTLNAGWTLRRVGGVGGSAGGYEVALATP